ncbi:MAG: hypothetical protein QXH20_00410 [Candidatus Bathyarchaeia archaeon]
MTYTCKPRSVTLIALCPYCNEETELTLNKKDVKQLLKGFKQSAKLNMLTLTTKCIRCQQEIHYLITKKELTALYQAFQKPTIAEAEKHAFQHIEYET